jgi:hypothetical protein
MTWHGGHIFALEGDLSLPIFKDTQGRSHVAKDRRTVTFYANISAVTVIDKNFMEKAFQHTIHGYSSHIIGGFSLLMEDDQTERCVYHPGEYKSTEKAFIHLAPVALEVFELGASVLKAKKGESPHWPHPHMSSHKPDHLTTAIDHFKEAHRFPIEGYYYGTGNLAIGDVSRVQEKMEYLPCFSDVYEVT